MRATGSSCPEGYHLGETGRLITNSHRAEGSKRSNNHVDGALQRCRAQPSNPGGGVGARGGVSRLKGHRGRRRATGGAEPGAALSLALAVRPAAAEGLQHPVGCEGARRPRPPPPTPRPWGTRAAGARARARAWEQTCLWPLFPPSSHGVVFGRPSCPGSRSSSSSRGLQRGPRRLPRSQTAGPGGTCGRRVTVRVCIRRTEPLLARSVRPSLWPTAWLPSHRCPAAGGPRRLTAPVSTACHRVGGRASPVPLCGASSRPL